MTNKSNDDGEPTLRHTMARDEVYRALPEFVNPLGKTVLHAAIQNPGATWDELADVSDALTDGSATRSVFASACDAFYKERTPKQKAVLDYCARHPDKYALFNDPQEDVGNPREQYGSSSLGKDIMEENGVVTLSPSYAGVVLKGGGKTNVSYGHVVYWRRAALTTRGEMPDMDEPIGVPRTALLHLVDGGILDALPDSVAAKREAEDESEAEVEVEAEADEADDETEAELTGTPGIKDDDSKASKVDALTKLHRQLVPEEFEGEDEDADEAEAPAGDPHDDDSTSVSPGDLEREYYILPSKACKDDVLWGRRYHAEVNNVEGWGIFVTLSRDETPERFGDVNGLVHKTGLPPMYAPGDFAIGDRVGVMLRERKDDGDLNFEMVAAIDTIRNVEYEGDPRHAPEARGSAPEVTTKYDPNGTSEDETETETATPTAEAYDPEHFEPFDDRADLFRVLDDVYSLAEHTTDIVREEARQAARDETANLPELTEQVDELAKRVDNTRGWLKDVSDTAGSAKADASAALHDSVEAVEATDNAVAHLEDIEARMDELVERVDTVSTKADAANERADELLGKVADSPAPTTADHDLSGGFGMAAAKLAELEAAGYEVVGYTFNDEGYGAKLTVSADAPEGDDQ